MSPGAKYILGVVPAVLLLVMALAGATFVFTFSFSVLQAAMVLSAPLGMSGLVWSFIGYSRRTAPLVLLLLLIGILGVLAGAYASPLNVFHWNARADLLLASPWQVLRLLLLSWLFLGPAVIGLAQARRVARVLWKRSTDVSLRT